MTYVVFTKHYELSLLVSFISLVLFCSVLFFTLLLYFLFSAKNSDTVECTDLNDLFNLGLWVEHSFFVKNAILRKKEEKNPDSCKGNLIVFGHEKTA